MWWNRSCLPLIGPHRHHFVHYAFLEGKKKTVLTAISQCFILQIEKPSGKQPKLSVNSLVRAWKRNGLGQQTRSASSLRSPLEFKETSGFKKQKNACMCKTCMLAQETATTSLTFRRYAWVSQTQKGSSDFIITLTAISFPSWISRSIVVSLPSHVCFCTSFPLSRVITVYKCKMQAHSVRASLASNSSVSIVRQRYVNSPLFFGHRQSFHQTPRPTWIWFLWS